MLVLRNKEIIFSFKDQRSFFLEKVCEIGCDGQLLLEYLIRKINSIEIITRECAVRHSQWNKIAAVG